jgi:hypothetical protein
VDHPDVRAGFVGEGRAEPHLTGEPALVAPFEGALVCPRHIHHALLVSIVREA